jgi:hypothetical protein
MKDTAVTTYIDNNEWLIKEFGWLYKSWLYSGSWRTSQIVAFHHPNIPKDKLPQDTDIQYIPLQPLTERDASWRDYPFINSTHFLTTPEAAILAGYKYVLKTDNDCFLTPFFPNLRPRLATFGVGLYATEAIVVAKLAEIAFKWGISPIFNSVGSTFMAHSNMTLLYSQIHMEYCKKMKADEFPDGYGTWPQWYFGVLTMYAGMLAANSLFGSGITMGGLDVHSMARDKICSTDYHIHAFHSLDHFSKLNWREGAYRDYDMSKLDRNNIADYCLWIAGKDIE